MLVSNPILSSYISPTLTHTVGVRLPVRGGRRLRGAGTPGGAVAVPVQCARPAGALVVVVVRRCVEQRRRWIRVRTGGTAGLRAARSAAGHPQACVRARAATRAGVRATAVSQFFGEGVWRQTDQVNQEYKLTGFRAVAMLSVKSVSYWQWNVQGAAVEGKIGNRNRFFFLQLLFKTKFEG